ncbi:CDP-archaeol synthase [Bradyrhizobium sp. 182]|uniref:CDP-archaeol synthase n=1 Tax=unclassified Bradyrhizobium TaxID=2631580 RepID=UPI001FFB379F|nr:MULTISPECIES: CDP-archaeol synthase [unclassified Bradyrhizobium]MCK1420277.1 CDP-archaeol synthase [Bradyrhizobium sp. CW12]MCK1527554.1 CDP-archaeol synthase [Bradyrhizobium sp. 182]MCK1646793.1 CDP-archaeol synthase [Bradyrhizobium sp. 154]
MQFLHILQLLVLMTLANGTPIVAKKIFGPRFSFPVDAGIVFFDGRPLFGPSKTIRGILISVLITTASAPLIGLDMMIGAIVAGAAMAGDLFSSFLKRRLNYPPSSQALGLDQIPESLFPMLACRDALSLTIADIALGVGIFFIGALILSRFLFRANLRDEPY